MDRVRSPFPRDIDVPVRFLDRFTIWDLARFGFCVGLGSLAAGPIGGILGIVISTVLILYTPQGIHLDKHGRNYVENLWEQRYGSWPDIKQVDDLTATLEDGSVVGLVLIQSCDIELQPEAEQRANQGVLRDLIQTVDFPLELHSLQLQRGLSELPGPQEEGKETLHYAVVRAGHSGTKSKGLRTQDAPEKPVDELKADVVERCELVSVLSEGADLTSIIVPQPLLEFTLDYVHLEDLDISSVGYETRKFGDFGQHRMVYVSNYPREVSVGWLSDILNIDGLVDVVQTVEPLSTKDRSKLSRTAGKLRVELAASNDPGNLSELQRAKQDAEDMLDAEISGESLVDYGVYIVAKDSNEADSDETLQQVKSVLRTHGMEYRQPVFESWKAAKTESIRYPSVLNKSVIVPSEAASAGFPFSTHGHVENAGIVLGTDTRNRMPVVVDRFSWDAPHIVRMGMTGSGKTVGTMLELLRSYGNYPDLRIRILDPKPDYQPLIDALDGETYIIDNGLPEDPGKVARYIVEDPSKDNTEALVEALQHVHRESCSNSEHTIVVVDEAHRFLTDSRGASALSTLVREGRSHSVGVSILTQNSDDLTQSTEGQNILRNTGCYLFMRHQDVDHSAEEFFNLSVSESIELRKLATGNKSSGSEAVIRGPVNTKLRIRLEDTEKELLLEEP